MQQYKVTFILFIGVTFPICDVERSRQRNPITKSYALARRWYYCSGDIQLAHNTKISMPNAVEAQHTMLHRQRLNFIARIYLAIRQLFITTRQSFAGIESAIDNYINRIPSSTGRYLIRRSYDIVAIILASFILFSTPPCDISWMLGGFAGKYHFQTAN